MHLGLWHKDYRVSDISLIMKIQNPVFLEFAGAAGRGGAGREGSGDRMEAEVEVPNKSLRLIGFASVPRENYQEN
ncbi:hypothetical protein EVAR_65048_1 [Eumeta japonica]|uniref:Uncharacterized protein n=1 Tax=Eumeta variegata TaxID=151549 RepID=A0A4C1ZPY1_EUMVA|nr:hypothetical protein EVAR_65048_1 [Eumeta japonica]